MNKMGGKDKKSASNIGEPFLNTLADSLPGIVLRYKLSPSNSSDTSNIGEILYLSESAKAYWEIDPESCLQDNTLFWNLLFKEDRPKVITALQLSAEKLTKLDVECRIHHSDGSLRWQRMIGQPYEIEGDSVILDAIVLEVIEEKKKWFQLKAQRNGMREMLNNALFLTFSVDSSGAFVEVSETVWETMGYQPNELIGRAFMDVVFDEDKQETALTALQIKEEKSLAYLGNRIVHKDASIIPMEWCIYWDEEQNLMNWISKIETPLNDTDDKVRQSEKRIKTLFENSADAFAIMNVDGSATYLSPNITKLLGYSESEFLEMNLTQLMHPEDMESVGNTIKEALENPGVPIFGNVSRARHKDGSWRWMEAVITNLLHDPNIKGIVDNFRDVTERVEYERKLKQSEEKYKNLFNLSPLPNWIHCLETYKILDVNKAAIIHYGYSREEFLDMTMLNLISKVDIERVLSVHKDIEHKEMLLQFGIFSQFDKSGKLIKMDISGQKISYNNHDCVMVVANDVTEKSLIQDLEKLEHELLESSIKVDVELEVQLENYLKGLETVFEGMKSSILWIENERVKNLAAPSLPETYLNAINGAAIGPQAGSCGRAAFKKQIVIVDDIDSSTFWTDYKGLVLPYGLKACWSLPIFDSNNNVIATISNFYGIIKKPSKKELELFNRSASLLSIILENHLKSRELIASNELYNYVNAVTNDAIYDWDVENDVFHWGESFTRIFGHRTEINGFTLSDWESLMHPEDISRTQPDWKAFLENPANSRWAKEFRFRKFDGKYAYVAEIGHLIRDETGRPKRMIGVLRDKSLQKEEEHRLKLMQSVIANTRDAVIISEAGSYKRPENKIVYVNDAFTRLTGYNADDVAGNDLYAVLGEKASIDELNNEKSYLKKRESSEVTTLSNKKNGEEYWINFTLSPVSNEAGVITHWISILRDVTSQKNIELQKKLLGEISQMFNRNLELKPTLENVLHHLVNFGNFSFAEAWLMSSDNQRLNLIANHLNDEAKKLFYKETEHVKSLKIGEGLPGKVWKKKSAELWDKIDHKKTFLRKEAAKKLGLKSALGLPLIHDEEVVGVLVFGTDEAKNSLSYYQSLFKDLETSLGLELKRKKLEEELIQLFKNSPDILCVAGSEGKFLKVNPAFSNLMGYTADELTARPFSDFIYQDDLEDTKLEYVDTISGVRHAHDFVNRYITKSGEHRWISWNSSQLTGEDGLSFAYGRDITDKKHLQDLLDSATSLARIGGWEIDLVENKLYWSAMTREIHEVEDDYKPELKTAINFYKETFQTVVTEYINKGIAEGVPWDFEALLVTNKGNECWVRIIGETEFRNGKCVRLFGSFQDIHQRKIAELNLQKILEEKNKILESIGDAFFAINREWIVTYWNKEAEKNLGTKREDIVGRSLQSLDNDTFTEKIYNDYKFAMKTGETVTFEEYYNALNKWFEVSVYPSESGLSVYFKDVSVRKAAEEQIRQSNERFEKVTQATNDAIWDWDIENGSLYRGSGFNQIFGRDINKMVLSKDFWTDKFHPEDRPQIIESIDKVIADRNAFNWVEEYRVVRDDKSIRSVIDRGIIIRNNKGKATRMVGAITDITHRKEFEESLKELNETLSLKAKELALSNAELEQFAFVASHDLQEPLRMVSSFLTQLEKKYGDVLDEKARRYIFFAVDGAKRMRQIILDLLDFSRVGKLEEDMESVNINEVIKEISLFERRTIEEKSAKLKFKNLPTIIAHRAPIFQVFQNLISNSIKYSKSGISPVINVSAEESIDQWEFSISDNGIGIDPIYFDRIFIIFQRLHGKDEYKGTGMGLAIVKKIIDNLGGKIGVESKEGEGSKFYFTIPKPKNLKAGLIV